MRKHWQSAVLAVLGVSTAAVLLWAGVLVYRWYEGYRLGMLIGVDATRDTHPGNEGQGAQQRMQAWKDFENRNGLVRERLEKLTEWQRIVAVTTAFDEWRACEPRPVFGTGHLWTLFNRHNEFDLMERMLDVPLSKTQLSGAVATSLSDAKYLLMDECRFQIWQACPDKELVTQSWRPAAGRSLREELEELTSQNDLRWARIDELIVIGPDKELVEFQCRVTRGHERVAALQKSPFVQARAIAEKLTDPVTLEFVETPLSDVVDFLRDYTGVNVLIPLHGSDVDGRTAIGFADQPVSAHVQSVPLRLALDCLLMPSGLDWDVVDGFLCIGHVTEVQSFRRRVSESNRKLARADEVLFKFLQSPLVTLSPGRETLKTDANGSVYGSVYAKRIEPGEYSATSIVEFFWATMVIYGPPSEFGTPLVCFSRNDLPFYRALDVVCELTGLVWEVQPSGSIRVVEAGK